MKRNGNNYSEATELHPEITTYKHIRNHYYTNTFNQHLKKWTVCSATTSNEPLSHNGQYPHILFTEDDQVIDDDEKELSTVDEYSCLSEYVSALVVHDHGYGDGDGEQSDGTIFNHESMLIDWQRIPDVQHFRERAEQEMSSLNEQGISGDRDDNNSMENGEDRHCASSLSHVHHDVDFVMFRHAAFHLRVWSDQLSELFNRKRLSICSLINMHDSILSKLGVEMDSIQYLFDNVTEAHDIDDHDEEDCFLQFSVFSTFVERLIASAYKTVRISVFGDHEEQVSIPVTLTEILATEELKQIFDEKTIFIVSAFMGRPTGLNLRNIIWHGFIESRGHLKHGYIQFLVVLYLSLCSRVIDWTTVHNTDFVWKKQLIQEDNCYCELYSKWMGLQTESLDDEMSLMIGDCKNIVEASFFVPVTRKAICGKIFDQLEKSVQCSDCALSNRYLHNCLALLFPQMEHLLRIVYVSVNPVKENMLRAESRELFSTLDILLHPTIESDYIENNYNGGDNFNRIGVVLGSNLTDALWDLFIHYQGPRLRDKVAHNEIAKFSRKLAIHFLIVFVCMAYRLTHVDKKVNIRSSLINSALDRILGVEYQPSYDVRIQFLNSWNEKVSFLDVLGKPTCMESPTVKELNEYYSTFTKYGYTLKKGSSNVECRQDIVQLIEDQFHVASKVSSKNAVEFNVSKILSYLQGVEQRLKLLESVHEDSSYALPLKYRDHFYASMQHISNVAICKKILEDHLVPIRSALSEKLQTLVDMIQKRTARTSHRKGFTTLVQCLPVLNVLFKVLLLILRRQFSKMQQQANTDEHADRQTHAALMKILSNTERLANSVVEGSYGFEITRIITYLVITNFD